MAVTKPARRKKGGHVFERTVKDLKTSVDALGRLLMAFVPGATSSRPARKKSAPAARRGTKRTVKASARTKAAASRKATRKPRRSTVGRAAAEPA